MKNDTAAIKSAQEFIKKGEDVLNEILKYFFVEPKNIDEIIDIYSRTIDKLIISSEKKDNILFKGGKFIITSLPDDCNVSFKANLFFQDSNYNWVKKEMFNNINKSDIEESSLKNMIEKKTEEFKINHPNY